MQVEALTKIFKRDLEKLKVELGSYTNEKPLWLSNGLISNSAGNLALHLVGNLNHYIGAILGNTGYIRKRDLEFSEKHVQVDKIVQLIDDTIEMLEKVLGELLDDDLKKEYPIEVFNKPKPMTTGYFLIHLTTHLAYHLGQINYHRRLLD